MRCVRYAAWLVFGLLVFPVESFAQGRTANWIFGDGYHVKYFDNDPVVMPFVSGFKAYAGASCISDIDGNLLFYSNTIRVWNANFLPLANSDTLPAIAKPPSSAKTNGSLFLPWPGDKQDRYFAFFQMSDADNRLYVSKIDRELDGGLGGVLNEYRAVQVWDHAICEQLVAIKHGNGRDWWILGRKGYPTSSQISLALLTDSGLEAMEYQSAGFEGSYIGEMTASYDGSMIAVAAAEGSCFPNPPIIGLYDFNRCDGSLSLRDTMRTLECSELSYGLAFSMLSNYLYYSVSDRIRLYRIDVSQDILTDTLVLKLTGPDFFLMGSGQLEQNYSGEILMPYHRVTTAGSDNIADHLAVVRYPDAVSSGFVVDTFAIHLNDRENTSLSLPNFANYDLGPLVGSPCDTLSSQDTTQTGLHHPPLETLSWSVNPSISSGSFTVTDGPASWLVVHDLYGREVLRQWHEERSTLDLTGQPDGVYLVYLRAADGTQTLPRKIVRQ